MTLRKFGTEPAKVEVRPEDQDPETLRLQAAFENSPVAAQVDEFLAHPETGVRRQRPQRD